MGTDIRKGFRNAKTGEFFRLIRSNRSEFTFLWCLTKGGRIPFKHRHPNQKEIFKVKKGTLQLEVNGRKKVIRAGESFVVKKDKKHIGKNIGNSTVECEVSYKPGLDTYKVFQCFGGLIEDGFIDDKGEVNKYMMGYFLKKMNAKAITIPKNMWRPVFKSGLNAAYVFGKTAGWHRYYKRYVD